MQAWDLFHDPAPPSLLQCSFPLFFPVASTRPLRLRLPHSKATAITSVAALFASTTYQPEVHFSPTVTVTHNHAI